MQTNLSLKNFRIFNEEGITVPLRPITILTGRNNSGKSSITKALCLLKDFCHQIETDFCDGRKLQLQRYKMDFHKRPNDILGAFNLVVHHQKEEGEIDNKEKDIINNNVSFEVVVESSWLLQDVIVKMEFAPLEWDDLKNGYLHSCSINTLDGKVIYKASLTGEASMDFSVVKKSLLHFLYGQFAFSSWQNELSYRMATSSSPADEDKEAKAFEKSMQCLINDVGGTALIYMLEWQSSQCHQPWKDGLTGPASSILKEVEDSFVVNSPIKNVFCYFPCFEHFQDMEKDLVIKTINEQIKEQEPSFSSFKQKIIDLFLKSFSESDASTLHDFVSEKENDLFVDTNILKLGGSPFPFSFHSYWKHDANLCLVYETEFTEPDTIDTKMPEKASLSVCILAMDYINQLTSHSKKRYVELDEINEINFYKLERFLDAFFRNTIEDIFAKIMPGAFTYSPTTIVRPQRLYSLEDDSDFTNTLKNFFEVKRSWISEVGNNNSWKYHHKDREKHQPCSFINKWLCQLGIAHHVDIKTHANGYGVTIHLYDSEIDEKGMLLADKGFGVLQLFAFLLKIENAILESQINEVRYPYYTDGLSKEIIKYLRTYNQLHPITIALEEPECHLHPSLQSLFADIIVDANISFGIHFLIESHSEYLIRKLQLIVSQKKISNDEVSLLYVNSIDRPSFMPAVTDIGVEEDGSLKNEFGSGFFDESLRLSKELFKSMEDKNEE